MTNQLSKTKHKRHSRKRETPAAIYLGIKIHAETRKRTLIDTFHKMGLCISYDHVLTISTDLVNSACASYQREVIVCPQILKKYVFCTAATWITIPVQPQLLIRFMVLGSQSCSTILKMVHAWLVTNLLLN